MDAGPYIKYDKFVQYVPGGKLEVNEPFCCVNKKGQKVFVPACVKLIGFGHKRHPRIPLEVLYALFEHHNDPDMQELLAEKEKNGEKLHFKIPIKYEIKKHGDFICVSHPGGVFEIW